MHPQHELEVQISSQVILDWEEQVRCSRAKKPELPGAEMVEASCRRTFQAMNLETIDLESAEQVDYEQCRELCMQWMKDRLGEMADDDSDDDDDDDRHSIGLLAVFERMVHGMTRRVESWAGAMGMTDNERASLERRFYTFAMSHFSRSNVQKDNTAMYHDNQVAHRRHGSVIYKLIADTAPDAEQSLYGKTVVLSFYEYIRFCLLSRLVHRQALEYLTTLHVPNDMRAVLQLGIAVHMQAENDLPALAGQTGIIQSAMPLFLGGRRSVLTDTLLGPGAFESARRLCDYQRQPLHAPPIDSDDDDDVNVYLNGLIQQSQASLTLLEACKKVPFQVVAVKGALSSMETLQDPLFLRPVYDYELPLWNRMAKNSSRGDRTFHTENGWQGEECQMTSEQFWERAASGLQSLRTVRRTLNPERDEDELEEMDHELAEGVPTADASGSGVSLETNREALKDENIVVYAECIDAYSVVHGRESASREEPKSTGWRFFVLSRAVFAIDGSILQRGEPLSSTGNT